MSLIKKKRYLLRVKQYKPAHLVYVVGTSKSDKTEDKRSSKGRAWSLPFFIFALTKGPVRRHGYFQHFREFLFKFSFPLK